MERMLMEKKNVYLLLSCFGFALPLWQAYPFFIENGIDIDAFIRDMFASDVSGFFSMDVIVTAVVVIYFVIVDGKLNKIKYAWISLIGLSIGVSLALPLYLYIRELKQDEYNLEHRY